MANPYAVKLANTESARKLIKIARGSETAYRYEEEPQHIRDSAESIFPRLVAETFEAVVARLEKLERENKKLRKELGAAHAAIEECERGINLVENQ